MTINRQGPFQSAATVYDRHGEQPAQDGGPRMDGPRLHHPIQESKDTGGLDPILTCRQRAELAGGPFQFRRGGVNENSRTSTV